MRVLLLLFFISTVQNAFCQYEKNYIPLKITDTIPEDLYKSMKDRLDKDLVQAKTSITNKEVRKYKCSLYEERTNTIVKMMNEDLFMIDTVFTPYLQSIADKIYAANPQLNKETRIFAYRSSIPNAVCFGEGTLAFNIGLLSRMENESQVAFIISHELAHHHLHHAEKRMTKLTELNFDKNLEKEINQIRKEEYNQYSKLKELLKDLTFDVTKHSRTNENEADSVGLSYLLKTSYDPWQAIRAMEILDSCDKPQYTRNIDLKKYFHFEKYPFKDSWLEYDTLGFIYAKGEYSDSDTASTHPDCKKRIMYMSRQLVNVKLKPSNREDKFFKELLIKSEFETIESLFHFGNLGRALFLTLIQLEKYPDNAYLHAMVGKCLYFIHHYQKNKEFGKVVALPYNGFPENYNRYLSFIHNLRMIELANISFNYVNSRAEKYQWSEEFLFAMILNNSLPVAHANSKEELIKEYKVKFPNGKYINELDQLLTSQK